MPKARAVRERILARSKTEELKQRGEGKPYGPYRFLNIGGTTLKALKERGLIPQHDYSGSESRKPDALILDDRGANTRVVASIEYKDDLYADDGVKQAATVGALLKAKVCLTTDNAQTNWFLPDGEGGFQSILDEGGQNYSKLWVSPDASVSAEVIAASQAAIEEVDQRLRDDRIVPERTLNPSALARSVWQDIYTAGDHPTPERALATFVEIFMFKFLSDLGVLTEDRKGHEISFDDVLKRSDDKCLRYYTDVVRPYVKETLFPPGEDGTTILNGFAFDAENTDHNHVFKRVLKKFRAFEQDKINGGPLLEIDREFKSRLFEEFLKGSVGQRSLGQFFTPRRLMGAIVDMAEVEKLPEGARVVDPACGVGGFPLETAARRARLLGKSDFNVVMKGKTPTLESTIEYRAFDKGSNQTESLAIILAKANFVIYQSHLLKAFPHATQALAGAFNEIFRAYSDSSLGSLAEINEGSAHLILSNPPYVASGARNLKLAAERAAIDYSAGGKGVEAMFLEKMVRELRPNGRAFIIIPDGILLRGQASDHKLRAWIARMCTVDALISLPVKTFFATPKKTYVLALTRKPDPTVVQTHPVFAYLVKDIGETLDAQRFSTTINDLPDMARRFRQFVAIKADLQADPPPGVELVTPKAKYIPFGELVGGRDWAVDRFWTKAEKVSLGLQEEAVEITEEDFYAELKSVRDKIDDLLKARDDG
ncbi:SAM-dependent DNA methyltransferase [Brevundimonas sp. M20]|nr:SAM-dependent DNA methyltransferase [Brevundimonas sp. M20]